jgi:hypothetical protein
VSPVRKERQSKALRKSTFVIPKFAPINLETGMERDEDGVVLGSQGLRREILDA